LKSEDIRGAKDLHKKGGNTALGGGEEETSRLGLRRFLLEVSRSGRPAARQSLQPEKARKGGRAIGRFAKDTRRQSRAARRGAEVKFKEGR